MGYIQSQKVALLLSVALTLGFYGTFLFHQQRFLAWPDESDLTSVVIIQGGEDEDPDVRAKRDKVRLMMSHAWKGYVSYAWGANELKPISKTSHNDSIFGTQPLGVTIIDSIDTLYIMGLMDEYNQAKDWLEREFRPDEADVYLSVFEVTIRLLGGLLSAHALTKEDIFYFKALQLGSRILPAFDTLSGIPDGKINLAKKASFGSGYVLAEWGTLSLEFNQLAAASGSDSFRAPIRRLYEVMESIDQPYGLFPVYGGPQDEFMDRITGPSLWKNGGLFSLGGMGDSFYEYLLKSWLQSGQKDEKSKQLYIAAMEGVINKLVQLSEKSKLLYLSQVDMGVPGHKMDHLSCFAGGMLALSGRTMGIQHHLDLGASLTSTCYQSYNRSDTKLGPESFRFDNKREAEADLYDAHYILRPEVVESYFILWRTTHDPKYRQWGWEAVEALETYCRIPSGGYSGLKNVYDVNSIHDDVQQSFFMAETLKYLYLLFSDDRLIALDQWVFNTEAHPLPIIRGGVKNPFSKF